MIKKLGAAAAVAVLLATSACGGGGRPSEADVSAGLQKGAEASGQTIKLSKAQADCAAKLFVESDLSDGALNAMVEGDASYKASDADTKAMTGLISELSKCQ